MGCSSDKEKPENNIRHTSSINKGWPVNYTTENLLNNMNSFINSSIIDIYSTFDGSDSLYNELIQKERQDLESFFNSKKSQFISYLNDILTCVQNDAIDPHNLHLFSGSFHNLCRAENAFQIIEDKINREISDIKQNKDLFIFKHFTILIVGKSGTGKSCLVNNVLRLQGSEKAAEGVGNIAQLTLNLTTISETLNF